LNTGSSFFKSEANPDPISYPNYSISFFGGGIFQIYINHSLD